MKPPVLLSGWALPCTVFLGAVSWLYVPFWYVAFQVLFGMYAGSGAPTPDRERVAGVMQMAASSVLAASLRYHWTWALWAALPMITASAGVRAFGRSRA